MRYGPRPARAGRRRGIGRRRHTRCAALRRVAKRASATAAADAPRAQLYVAALPRAAPTLARRPGAARRPVPWVSCDRSAQKMRAPTRSFCTRKEATLRGGREWMLCVCAGKYCAHVDVGSTRRGGELVVLQHGNTPLRAAQQDPASGLLSAVQAPRSTCCFFEPRFGAVELAR
eukprot:3182434-Prymnesium_polylepis.3